jgi:transposase
MQGKKHYQEKLFTNFHLSERIPQENFYRRLKDVLPLQWLYKSTQKYYGSEGQPSIDPVVFFKLMLIGYLENQCSDRRIINMASLRLDMLYFIGYDIDEPLPWHSTLSRTRQLYGEEIFKELFKKVLSLCIDKGMVAGKRQAMDSVAVQANASMESLQRKAVLNDIDNYADELNDEEENPAGQKNTGLQNSEEIKQDLLQVAPSDKEQSYNGPGWNKSVSNYIVESATDKDARVSVKPGKARRLNYLAQVSVDTANHVITQIQSDFADKKDSQCLPSLLHNTIGNLSEHALQIEEILADGNYSSSEALRTLEKENIIGYIPNFGQYKPSREGFLYDKENDRYLCSQGKVLEYKSIKESHGNGNKMKQYRSSSKDCSVCPLKNQCIGRGLYKTIAVTVDKELFEKMHNRLQTPIAKRMKKLRSSTVEPVLGTLVNFLGMRRVHTKGIALADKCMTMAAIAYNIKKVLRWQNRKSAIIAKSQIKNMKESVSKLIFHLFEITLTIGCYRRLKIQRLLMINING